MSPGRSYRSVKPKGRKRAAKEHQKALPQVVPSNPGSSYVGRTCNKPELPGKGEKAKQVPCGGTHQKTVRTNKQPGQFTLTEISRTSRTQAKGGRPR